MAQMRRILREKTSQTLRTSHLISRCSARRAINFRSGPYQYQGYVDSQPDLRQRVGSMSGHIQKFIEEKLLQQAQTAPIPTARQSTVYNGLVRTRLEWLPRSAAWRWEDCVQALEGLKKQLSAEQSTTPMAVYIDSDTNQRLSFNVKTTQLEPAIIENPAPPTPYGSTVSAISKTPWTTAIALSQWIGVSSLSLTLANQPIPLHREQDRRSRGRPLNSASA